MSTYIPPTNEQLDKYIVQNITALQNRLTAMMDADRTYNDAQLKKLANDVDMGWVVICGALVFLMQAGFGVLEAGAVRTKNVTNILFKNVLDASVASLSFFLIGYGIAYGKTAEGIIGTDNFVLLNVRLTLPSFLPRMPGSRLNPTKTDDR